jgi:predicted unusual protein kinase regulating ubiquinone biosynthesis (AarF/ABC1/UbiB family)
LSVPFLLKTATLLVQGGVDALQENDAELARDARVICEQLGPTFIKLAQTLSVRPDVLPPSALAELAVLQDSVVPFETDVAIDIIEKELGGPLGAFFSTISEEPVAAASLAQVYKAQLDDGRSVAVKVQRPQILEQVSKDLYVLRRAAEVYQRLIDRFAPQQKTNYVDLLNEWAVGFYTELDFRSEIDNLNAIRDVLVRVEISQWSAPRDAVAGTTSRRWRGGRRFDFRAGARRGRARGAARRARRGTPRGHDCRRRLRALRARRIMHG